MSLKDVLSKEILKKLLDENPDLNPYPRAGRKKGSTPKDEIDVQPSDLADIQLSRAQVKQLKAKTKKPNVVSEEEKERRLKILAQGRAKLQAIREEKKKSLPDNLPKEKQVKAGEIRLKVKPKNTYKKKNEVENLISDSENNDFPTEEESTDVEFRKIKKKIQRRKKAIEDIEQTLAGPASATPEPRVINKYEALFSTWN